MKYGKYMILFFLVGLIGCAPESPILVTIDNCKYTIADFKAYYQFSATEDSSARMEKIDEFINRMLVVREAEELGYEEDPIVKSAFETHRKDIISRGYYESEVIDKIKISNAEMRKIYNQIVDQYHIAQIVVAEESLAQYISDEIKKGMPFDSLLEFSLDTLSINGDAGTHSAISLPPEMMEQLKKTKDGDVTGIIKLGNYFHIFKVLEHKIADTPKFEDVEVGIKNDILKEKAIEKGGKFSQEILDNAKIEYNQEGLDVLMKPDSLITEVDLNKWVVKKYDTAYVYVRTILPAVQHQYQQSLIDPKQLIDRVLFPDLVYDAAMKVHFDKTPKVKKKLQNTMDMIVYQKLYSDAILEKATIDSMEAMNFYKEHKNDYKGKKSSEAYVIIKNELRDKKIESMRNDFFEDLKNKYYHEINELTAAKLLREEI